MTLIDTPHEIEQLLREGFPFAKQWFFNCAAGCAYYLQSEQATIALNCYSPHGVFAASWGAKLEGTPYWVLAGNEGPTPAEAVSNLQVAIAQIAAINAAMDQLTRDSLEEG